MVQYRNAKDMDIGPTFITRYWHNIIFTLANIGQYYSDISHWEYIVPILVEYQRATWEPTNQPMLRQAVKVLTGHGFYSSTLVNQWSLPFMM